MKQVLEEAIVQGHSALLAQGRCLGDKMVVAAETLKFGTLLSLKSRVLLALRNRERKKQKH